MANTKKPSKKRSDCHDSKQSPHPDHSDTLPRLNRVVGQIQGIQKMIDEGRYCVDILIQFRAAMAAMRTIETEIFQRHLQHCVKDAMDSKDESKARKKIQELSDLLIKRTSL